MPEPWRDAVLIHAHVDPGPVAGALFPESSRQGLGVAVAEGVVQHRSTALLSSISVGGFPLIRRYLARSSISCQIRFPLPGVFDTVDVGLKDGVFDAQFRGFVDHDGTDAAEPGGVQQSAVAVVNHREVEGGQVPHVFGHFDRDRVEYESSTECLLKVFPMEGSICNAVS